eukprot:gene4077-4631_t
MLLAVGQLGKEQLAGAGLGISFCNLTGMVFGVGFIAACDTLFSQAYGVGNFRRIGIVAQRALLISLLCLCPLVSLWINAEWILLALGQNPLVARPLIKRAPEVCDSTEDLFSHIRTCNEDVELETSVVGSMDVAALYPFIDIDFSIDKCIDFSIDKCIDLMNEVGKNKNERKRWLGWIESREKPTTEQKVRKMMSFAIAASLRLVLKNHIFKFNNKLYKQMKGGAIGVAVAGDVSNVFMIWLDRELKAILHENRIEVQLYSRYVDDINIVAKAINDKPSEPRDKVTMEKIQVIANEIHECIKVTIDYPSNHENNRMPVLDVEQWVQPTQCNGATKSKILHSHYMKPMASKQVLNKDSALSQESKTNILVADLVKVMRNVSPLCSNIERTKHIQRFVNWLQFSGYPQKDGISIYKRANQNCMKIVENDNNGICPMYRGKFWNRLERVEERCRKRNTWFEKGDYETLLFVDATPGSQLAKECRKIMKAAELKIKVIERSGKPLRKYLTRSDPF